MDHLADQILYREAKPLRQIDGEIPAELERICLKCLNKAVVDRYATAMDLADDRSSGRHVDPEKYMAKSLLSELRARGNFTSRDCLSLGATIARAADCMHKAGLVHRDIKPANIVYLDDTPKLADIGSVKLLDDSISIAGTEGYMPLEGPGRPAGDIFSLGKVL